MNGNSQPDVALNISAFDHVNKYHTGDSIGMYANVELFDTSYNLRSLEYTDWFEEESHADSRLHEIRTGHGLKRLLGVALDSAKLWVVVLITGVGIGILGGWLDILVAWYVSE